jgi:Ser/Thr protein kinase RdoA (MazF antagonist)
VTGSFYDWPVSRQTSALRQLGEVALGNYDGAFSRPELVKYRENAIFAVRRDDGAKFALRIHRHGYHSDASLASELAWMEALGEAGIEAPRVMHARDGRAVAFAAVPEVPERRQVDLLSWLDGRPLGELEAGGALSRDERRSLYQATGALAARLHNHAANWQRPPGFARHDWFADALVGETPLWGRFWELQALSRAEAALLQTARERARRGLGEYGVADGNSGLIHADLVPDNVLVNGAEVRPIDFDDAGFGWNMFELATILYFTLEDPDHAGLRQAVIEGYRSVRPLPDRDEQALELFLLVRGMTYLGWVHTRSETATAREGARQLIERCCRLCSEYV